MNRETAVPAVDSLSGGASEEWIAAHQDVAAPSEYSQEFVWDITGDAHGPFVTDLNDNVVMDFTCHIGAAPLGYNNPKILDKLEGFDLIDPLKIAGQDFYFGSGSFGSPEYPGSTQLMNKLTDMSSQYGMDTVFLSNSGAEAVENAMKVAYDACESPKYGFTFSGSFHGRTLGTLSLTRSKSVYTREYQEISGIREVPFCQDRGCSPETCSCGFLTGEQSRLETILGPGGHVDPRGGGVHRVGTDPRSRRVSLPER
jgi:4-aminobutyrate aminotransferase and related aminotransferases